MTHFRPRYLPTVSRTFDTLSIFGKGPDCKSLTGLHDGACLMDTGRQMLKTAKDQGKPLCTALFDIDGAASDTAEPKRSLIADALSRRFGAAALIARYGDEALAVMVYAPDDVPDAQAAHHLLNELRSEIKNSLAGDNDAAPSPAVSIAAVVGQSRTLETLLSKVDELLSTARDAGSDCTATSPIRELVPRLTRTRRRLAG